MTVTDKRGVAQLTFSWVGFLLGVVNPVTHTMGFQVLKKILEKKFGAYYFFVLPLAGWVGMSM
jgi:hypothetical protein